MQVIRAAKSVCPDVIVITQDVDDWGVAECPAGTYLLGGGCENLIKHRETWDGKPEVDQRMEASYPHQTTNQWVCGGWSVKKRITALCSATRKTTIAYRKCSGSVDDCFVTCPDQTTMIGGGCHGLPNTWIQISAPYWNTNSFYCMVSEDEQDREGWAICLNQPHGSVKYPQYRAQRGQNVSSSCPQNYQLIGGGCYNLLANPSLDASFPISAGAYQYWHCESSGNEVYAQASCIECTGLPSA